MVVLNLTFEVQVLSDFLTLFFCSFLILMHCHFTPLRRVVKMLNTTINIIEIIPDCLFGYSDSFV